MLPELERAGRVRRPFLGVRGRECERRRAGRGGPGRHARPREAGIRGGDREAIDERDGSIVVLGGDVLTQVGGRGRCATMDDVHAALGELRPGQAVAVELRREGKPVKATVRLGERPGGAAAE